MRPKLGFWEKPRLDYFKPYEATGELRSGMNFKTAEVRHIAEAFDANFNRSLNDFSLLTAAMQWAYRAGVLAAAGSSEASPTLYRPPTRELTRQLKSLFDLEEQLEEERQGTVDTPGFQLGCMAVGVVNDWLSNHGAARRMLEASLQSVVVYAWTALEVLLIDTWVAVVNLYPDPLAINAMRENLNPKTEKTDEEDKLTKAQRRDLREQRGQEKSETLDFIERAIKYGEPIQAGNLLRLHKNRFNFDKFEDILKIYSATFKHKQIRSVLYSVDMMDMYVLDALRNAIVHNGARVDRRFYDKSNAEESRERYGRYDLLDLDINEEISLYGEQIHDLLTAEVKAAKALLRFIDDWLVDHGHLNPPPEAPKRPTSAGWPFAGFISIEDQEAMRRSQSKDE